MTHMAVDIFPVLNCDIHNEVVGNRQYIGRGISDDDNELENDLEEDDEYDIVTDDDGDTDEEVSHTPRNPYILDEIDEDENEDDDDNDDDTAGGGRTKEERLRSYVKALSRGTRNATLIILKNTMSQHNAASRSSSAALYKKLCFFAQVARWHLKQDNKNNPDEKAIHEKALRYYHTYKYHFNMQSDDMFEGVHVTVVHLLEHIYKTRINVYESHSLKKRPRHGRVNPKRETVANKYQPVIQPVYLSSSNGGHVYKRETLNLLLHDNHYYTIPDMNKLTTAHYRCISCGQMFKGRRMSVIKKHIQE